MISATLLAHMVDASCSCAECMHFVHMVGASVLALSAGTWLSIYACTLHM